MTALHSMTAKALGKEITRRQEKQSQAAEALFDAADRPRETLREICARLGEDHTLVTTWKARRLSLLDADSEARRRYGPNAVSHDAHWPFFLAQVK